MPAQLPYGWVITPTLETVPNPNEGSIPYGTPFFQRWTYICTDADGDYICSSGSLEDCESQAQAMAQAHVQQQPYYPGPPPGKDAGWLWSGGPVPVPASPAHANEGYGALFNLTAGIVDCAGEAIVWSVETTSGTPPTLVPGGGCTVTVAWNGPATVTLSATVGGLAQASSITAQATLVSVTFGPSGKPFLPGWGSTIGSPGSVYLHSNSGVGYMGSGLATPLYAGVESYNGGAVAWFMEWTPVGSVLQNPAPVLTPLSGGEVAVQWPLQVGFTRGSAGILRLTCSVGGVPLTDSIEMSVAPGVYADWAWGPMLPGMVAAWAGEVTSSTSAPIAGTSGSGYYVETMGNQYYAGVAGYVLGNVVWSAMWLPTYGGAPPVITPQPFGKVQIDWPANPDTSPNLILLSQGLLILECMVGGVSVGSIDMACDGRAYSAMTWAPVVPPPPKLPGYMTPTWLSDSGVPDYAKGAYPPANQNFYYGAGPPWPPVWVNPTIGPLFAGLEGYAGETVVWSATWTPDVADPSPTITPLSGGRVQVSLPVLGPNLTSTGLLRLKVTINGQAVPAGIALNLLPTGLSAPDPLVAVIPGWRPFGSLP